MKVPRSLTLRLALLYAASTLLILLSVAFYMIQVVDNHFVEQDVGEMRGKLALAARLIANVPHHQLPARLDDALVGHHHLSLVLFAAKQPTYHAGHAPISYERIDLRQLFSWEENGIPHRGLAMAVPERDLVIAVAVDTTHHLEFINSFQRAMWAVLALATLAAATLGWGVARAGLGPLRQTAHLARQITAEALDRRLPTDGIPPELEELSAAFNAMLDRLRDAFERLSGFAADLAHEMRTPVNNLMMQTQVMLGQARSVEEYREVLASNLEEYERLARTIGDMLFLAKADNGLIVPTRETVDLRQEVAELFEFFEALAEDRNITLEQSGMAMVTGDRLMLRRALANLISNGIRYAPAGSYLGIQLSSDDSGILLSCENACAAPLPEPLEQCFDRFYRADPARRDAGDGAGLGLAITRSIARAHGGDATVCAISGGIRFELRLPCQ